MRLGSWWVKGQLLDAMCMVSGGLSVWVRGVEVHLGKCDTWSGDCDTWSGDWGS